MSTVKANFILDSAGGNTAQINGSTPALSSQAQAEAGTDNTTLMTPLRVAQSIATLGEPNVFLGTLTTTSGNIQTLSSLDLTPYKFLLLVFNAVSHNDASVNKGVYITSISTLALFTLSNSGDSGNGAVTVDLATGIFYGSFTSIAGRFATAGSSGLSTSSTSVSVAVAAVAAFDAGSIRIYGVR